MNLLEGEAMDDSRNYGHLPAGCEVAYVWAVYAEARW